MTDKNDSYAAFKALMKQHKDVEVVPVGEIGNPRANKSGSTSLDLQLHIPFPGGNQHEIFGPPGTGKTTIALSILGYAQSRGQHVAYVNEEGTINRSLLDTISTIDMDGKDEFGNPTFSIINTPYAELSLEAIRAFVQQKDAVVAVDSIDSMVPRSISESDFADQHMGTLGKLMSRVCRDFAKILPRTGATIIWLNQIRSSPGAYGDPKSTSGGWAIKFYANQRLELKYVKKANYIEDGEGRRIGMKVPYEVIKNKCVPPYVKGELPIKFGFGIWESLDLLDVATTVGAMTALDRGRVLPLLEWSSLEPPFKCDGETSAFLKHVIPFLDDSPEARIILKEKVEHIIHGT